MPFLDHITQQFEVRFTHESDILVNSFVLVPRMLVNHVNENGSGSWNAAIFRLVNQYSVDFPNKFKLKTEMDIY